MKNFLTLICLAGIAARASAQAPTATYTWQLSTDSGVTWSNAIIGGIGTINVRLLATWTGIPDAVGVGYAGGQFDATILADGVSVGSVSNIARPVPFTFASQTLVASTVTGGLKIDTAADFLAPGAGTGWVNPGQAARLFNPDGFNSINGAVVFSYDFLPDAGNGDTITFGMVLNGTMGRAMAVYSSESGTQIRIDDSLTTVNQAYRYLPTPGSLAQLGLSALTVTRRRRVSHTQI